MKLLSAAEERRRKQHLAIFFDKLREFSLFESLDDDALLDLAALLEHKTYKKDKDCFERKGIPGMTSFYNLLSGTGRGYRP